MSVHLSSALPSSALSTKILFYPHPMLQLLCSFSFTLLSLFFYLIYLGVPTISNFHSTTPTLPVHNLPLPLPFCNHTTVIPQNFRLQQKVPVKTVSNIHIFYLNQVSSLHRTMNYITVIEST